MASSLWFGTYDSFMLIQWGLFNVTGLDLLSYRKRKCLQPTIKAGLMALVDRSVGLGDEVHLAEDISHYDG